MLIYVNKQKVELDLAGVKDLEEVLARVQQGYLPPGGIPHQVRVNGQPYSEDYPHASREIAVESIYALEIETVSQGEFVNVVLDGGARELEKICEAFRKAADLLRMGDEAEANQTFVSCLDSLRWFLRLIQDAQKTLSLDFKKIPFGQHTVEGRLNKLLDILDVMMKVQEERDYIILADLVEYELLPLLNEWKEIVRSLKRN